MTHESVAHGTTTLTQSFRSPPARVFAAWADPAQRKAWSAPSDEVEVVIDAADFAVGGEDRSRCVYGGEVVAVVTGRYHDIVPDRRIVYTEVIANPGANEGACLVSAEFLPRGEGTVLVVTLQCAALDGAALLEGVKEGWTIALGNLSRQLEPA